VERTVSALSLDARGWRSLAWGAAGVLFAVALPILLISSNVRLIVNSTRLYEWDFNRYEIESRTGLSRDELRSAAAQIRTYFNNDEELLDLRVSFGDGPVPLFREREILHMRDVKTLMRGVFSAQLWTVLYALGFVAAGLLVRRTSFLQLLRRSVIYSGIGSALVVAGVGLAAVINFDAVFTRFHLISFANDLWLLDPYSDYLLIMFPQGFFLDATLAIAVFTIVEFAAIAGAVWWVARRVAAQPGSDG
jgi:integral membrane protein (TIGR01906 family)